MHPVSSHLAFAQNIMNPPATKGPSAEVVDLQMRVERQSLLLQTLLMILLEKKVIHDDEFREWMTYVDELDGSRDGRLREDRSPRPCPQCNRRNKAAATNCQYCGAAIESEYLMHQGARPQG
jgi:hypothetical protein